MDSSGIPGPRQVVIEGKVHYPPEGRHFSFPQRQVNEMYEQGRIRVNPKSGKPEYLVLPKDTSTLDTNWTDISGYSFGWDFQTENSERLLERVIETTTNRGDFVADYFLGSSTTTSVAHKMGRKWLGIEMGEHFHSVILPRMKKVLAYDKSGISKGVKDYQGGGCFKYLELEQYEDTLRRARYGDADLFDDPNKDPYHQYVFLRDLKMLEALEVDTKKNKVKVDLNKLYNGIDIAETLSNLTGKWIKRITADSVEFDDGEVVDTKNLDWKRIKPLIWW